MERKADLTALIFGALYQDKAQGYFNRLKTKIVESQPPANKNHIEAPLKCSTLFSLKKFRPQKKPLRPSTQKVTSEFCPFVEENGTPSKY